MIRKWKITALIRNFKQFWISVLNSPEIISSTIDHPRYKFHYILNLKPPVIVPGSGNIILRPHKTKFWYWSDKNISTFHASFFIITYFFSQKGIWRCWILISREILFRTLFNLQKNITNGCSQHFSVTIIWILIMPFHHS